MTNSDAEFYQKALKVERLKLKHALQEEIERWILSTVRDVKFALSDPNNIKGVLELLTQIERRAKGIPDRLLPDKDLPPQ